MMKNEINFSETENCPVRNILDRFGDKWSTLVILILGNYDTLRFNELQKMDKKQVVQTALKNGKKGPEIGEEVKLAEINCIKAFLQNEQATQ